MSIINSVWGIVEPICALITFFFVARTFLAVRKTKKQLTVNAQEGTAPVIINFTGHPLKAFQNDWAKGIEHVNVSCTVPVGDGQNAVEKFFVELITNQLSAELVGRIMAGDTRVYVAAPNMCTGEFLAVWHAVSGQFPCIIRSVRAGGAFVWQEPRDLQSLRLETRAATRG